MHAFAVHAALVPGEMARLREPLAAAINVARKWLLARVRELVLGEIAQLREPLAAAINVARERLLARVREHVPGEMARRSEPLAAAINVAREAPVCHHRLGVWPRRVRTSTVDVIHTVQETHIHVSYGLVSDTRINGSLLLREEWGTLGRYGARFLT